MSTSTRTPPAWAPWKTALLLCAVQLVPIYVTTMVESAFK